MATTVDDPTRVVVGPLTLSYPALFTPRASEEGGQDARYSAEFWLYSDNPHAAEIHSKLSAAMAAACAEKNVQYNPHTMPAVKPVDPARTEGKTVYFFRANSQQAPELFVRRSTDGPLEPANAADNMYAGCLVYVSVKAAYYDFRPPTGGIAKGVKFYLNAVCQTGDGPRLAAAKPNFASVFSATPMHLSEFTTPPSQASAFSDAAMAPWQQQATVAPSSPPPWQQQAPAALPSPPPWQQQQAPAAPPSPAPQMTPWQQPAPASPPSPQPPVWQQPWTGGPPTMWQQPATGDSPTMWQQPATAVPSAPPGPPPASWQPGPPAAPGWPA